MTAATGARCGEHRTRGRDYVDMFGAVSDAPWLIGWHWCALAENQARGWGLNDPWDNPYESLVEPVQACNRRVRADHQKRWP